jgi:hypothetical protein
MPELQQQWTYSYSQFRAAAGLTKKEADRWVRSGVIQAERVGSQRRVYRFESIFEGVIARQLAGFSSRELLPKTMTALRRFMVRERIRPHDIVPDLAGPHQLVAIRTEKSQELTAGGGVRGLISHAIHYDHVFRYDREAPGRGGSVFLVVDLTAAVVETIFGLGELPPS